MHKTLNNSTCLNAGTCEFTAWSSWCNSLRLKGCSGTYSTVRCVFRCQEKQWKKCLSVVRVSIPTGNHSQTACFIKQKRSDEVKGWAGRLLACWTSRLPYCFMYLYNYTICVNSNCHALMLSLLWKHQVLIRDMWTHIWACVFLCLSKWSSASVWVSVCATGSLCCPHELVSF